MRPIATLLKAAMWQSEPTTKPVGGTQGCSKLAQKFRICDVATERNDHIPTSGFMQR